MAIYLKDKGCAVKSEDHGHLKHDKIRMTVNIPERSLVYYSIVQEMELGRYTQIDYSMSYRFAVSLTGPQSVKITDFTIKTIKE